MGGGRFLYVMGNMWSPGLAALLTLKIHKRKISELGWNWGNTKFQVWSYLIPICYCLVTYVIVWITGYGGFYNTETVKQMSESFGLGELNPVSAIILFVLLDGTFGIIRMSAYTLGEEIGWRGFLVPELFKKFSYAETSLLSGLIWSLWHYPVLIFSNYNSGTPVWYGLTCFTVMVVSSCFIYTWFRIKSNNLWTGVIFHASHNLFIQQILTPLTYDTGSTKYIIDEFGIGLAIVSVALGFYFWTKRGLLTVPSS